MADVADLLKAVAASSPNAERVANDPVRYAHRYVDPLDQEVAALFASVLAYGRVAAFFTVLDKLFDEMDDHGGPAAWLHAEEASDWLLSLRYRFTTGADLLLLRRSVAALSPLDHSLELIFVGSTLRARLAAAIARIREVAAGLDPEGEASRGFRYSLASPVGGSACKRWLMFMRWMVRPADGVDLGLWESISPSELVIPLDTHTSRIARLLGLTERRDASWRTALEVTSALSAIDPLDPVRFDFALAHTGISDGCRGSWHEPTCTKCPLQPACTASVTL